METKVKTRTKLVKNYVQAVGRRRSAVARVRLYSGAGKIEIGGKEYKKGDMIVNDLLITDFFKFKAFAPRYNKMLLDMKVEDKFVISAKVVGGGNHGQLEAFLLGIARSLDKFDTETYHDSLREKGYLTRDSRIRERRKVGNAGKARRKKSSPKR